MNALRTNSYILVAVLATFVGKVHAVGMPEQEVARLKATLQHVAPIVTKKALKHQNPYLSDVAQGLTATLAHKLDMPAKGKDMDLTPNKGDGAFFVANSGVRCLGTLVAKNTSLNEKKFEKFCDDNLPECMGKVVKYLAPVGLEFVYNSIAASVAAYVNETK
jgi:hypothetical protein